MSLIVASVLHQIGVPASTLIGFMVSAIAFALVGKAFPIPSILFGMAQATLGQLIATRLDLPSLDALYQDISYALLSALIPAIAASILIGWSIRKRLLPPGAAFFGISPGGATAMTILAGEFGADTRVVAAMQYTRVVVCSMLTTTAAALLGVSGTMLPAQAMAVEHTPPLSTIIVLSTALFSVVLSRIIKLPAGPLLFGLLLGVLLTSADLHPYTVPVPVSAVGLALIGLSVGGRFTRDTIHIFRKYGVGILLNTMFLIVLSALIALIASNVFDVNLLTILLASSPGGVEAAVLVGFAGGGDMNIIISAQVIRAFTIILISPLLAHLLLKRDVS
ncbi:AbrB family transcriptional regulator [Sinorhizobium meliloti]|uniref:AbrB family transcriptional regulator n=1 Tax=Rhizobium meliloti TaxID=382 RepID=UPI0018AD375A|nr:AbrB family transcriptional regulator [Sinorhizobium meliloti]MDE4615951.1 AbrB family transcriptional regulator [Sinorhizobium meliloti]